MTSAVTLSTLVSQYFSLIWFLLDVKEPTPLFKKSKGVLDPGDVANLSWAGWVIVKERS